MTAKDDTGQPPRTERNDYPAAWSHAMAQRLRQGIGESLIERDGKTYVAKLVVAGGHQRLLIVAHALLRAASRLLATLFWGAHTEASRRVSTRHAGVRAPR